ncbi:unnamed protein product [Arctia plantaginis]|uniref:Major facilitator superfamily (MFS) profile domain-containing protein n=1 Tax=Arctia plantaginis TaxID=874455 RepID=A0A8S1BPM5_ARCPL|nr:unnamed protein product [Arctia plantaginis]
MPVGNVVYGTVPSDEKSPEPITHPAPKGLGLRHLQTLLLFVCLVLGFTTRAQLSVLMVAMIKSSQQGSYNLTSNGMDVNGTNITDNTVDSSQVQPISDWNVYRTYEWDKATQEIILFSFFVGYTSMQIPMGWLAQKVGGKIPIMIALAVSGILSILTPWIPLIGGWMGVTVCRLIQGMTQAAFYPSLHTILARWTPLSERGRLTAYTYTGSQIGTIIAFQVSGLLAGSPVLGWPSSFWVFGILSLVVCGLFGWLGAATPHEHPKITTEELVYILEGGNADVVPKKRKTPWREILKSPSVWGIVITQSGSSVVYLLVLTEIPLYMKNILGVDIKRNGLYSSLPYLAMYLMSVGFGNLSDFLRNRNIMSLVNIRRAANTTGTVVSGIFLLAFSFMSSTLPAVILLIVSLGMHSGIHAGFVVNIIDLAPNFAGSIMSLSNMLGSLTTLLIPVVVSNIVTDVTNPQQWQIVFIICVGYKFITNALFVIFASADVQPWNFYGEVEHDSEDKEMNLIEEKSVKEKEMNQAN